MQKKKLFDSEFKIMEIIWEMQPVTAKEVVAVAAERLEWNKNTTYTVLKKLTDKNIISRAEPNFLCRAIVNREDFKKTETAGLIDRLYGGSKKAFISAFVANELSEEEREELRAMIEKK